MLLNLSGGDISRVSQVRRLMEKRNWIWEPGGTGIGWNKKFEEGKGPNITFKEKLTQPKG